MSGHDGAAPSPASIAVCCVAVDHPAVVAGSLRLLRDVVDEVVVAVDGAIPVDQLAPLVEVADAVTRFEHVAPTERVLPWLVGSCRADSVLVVEGTEVAGAAFVDALPSLAADQGVIQTRVAQRWCFPDERTWLAERPWWPDLRVRLARRDAGLDIDVCRHGGLTPRSPARFVDAPFYELSCVVGTFPERRRLARRSAAERPGLTGRGGGPLDDTVLVPEHYATRRPVAVPDDDIGRLRAVVDGRSDRRAPTVALPFLSAAEIGGHVPPDPLLAARASAGLRVVELDLRTEPGHDTALAVEVVNSGPVALPADDVDGIRLRLVTSVLDRRPGRVPSRRATTSLLADVPPGSSRLVEARVQVPDEPGVYTVDMVLVNERGSWTAGLATFDLRVAHRWARHTV